MITITGKDNHWQHKSHYLDYPRAVITSPRVFCVGPYEATDHLLWWHLLKTSEMKQGKISSCKTDCTLGMKCSPQTFKVYIVFFFHYQVLTSNRDIQSESLHSSWLAWIPLSLTWISQVSMNKAQVWITVALSEGNENTIGYIVCILNWPKKHSQITVIAQDT